MSEDAKVKRKPLTRLRRQRKDGKDESSENDSGEESDTIFEEQSDYESAEEDHGELIEETASYQEAESEGPDYVEEDEPSEPGGTQEDRPIIILTRETAALDISGDQSTDLEQDLEVTPQHSQTQEDEQDAVVIEDKDAGEAEDEDGDETQEKGEDGEGQQEEEEKENLDDDEDLKNPAYIPRTGAYYQHDVRNDGKEDKRPRRDRRLWKEDNNKWLHDKFNEEEQAPKSQWELVNYHGYDIRDPTEQDRSDQPHRRGRGRGNRGRGYPSRGGRGRGRGFWYQRSPQEDGDGDRRPEPRRYIKTEDLEPRKNNRTEDFPALPGHRVTSEPVHTPSYTDRAWGRRDRDNEMRHDSGHEAPSIRMKYQSEKTYYERDGADHGDPSFRNVTADFRYRPSGNRTVNAYRAEQSEYESPKTSSRSYVDRIEPAVKKEPHHEAPPSKSGHGDQKSYYQLEFVNSNYQAGERETDDGSLGAEDRLSAEEEGVPGLGEVPAKSVPQESPRKTYSQERMQRGRPQGVGREEGATVDGTDRGPPIVNLKIKVEGSERIVQYEEDDYEEGRDEVRRQRFADDDDDNKYEEEEQRADRREQRSRPKRYSSQRQRGQDVSATQSYYEKGEARGVQQAAEPSTGREAPANPHQRGGALPPERSPNQAPPPRRHSPQSNQAVQSSLPANLQNMMQQGMMMPPDAHGMRAPHLPSPAFFQQQQGPPPYYVPPMVNYGSPQYPPMATPLQFQHYPMGMPQPPPAVPNNPPAPPPSQSQAPPSSAQQVGGVTYYSPLQQPLLQPPHKRPSKPITIESPPDIHPR